MSDFVSHISVPDPCDSFLDFSHMPNLKTSYFTATHVDFLSNLSNICEPHSYAQACKYPHWNKAMTEELRALEKNNTWELTTLPVGKKPIGSNWVYKVKVNSDGTGERFKACLVAKGYNQIKGIDFTVVFSLVA